MSSRTKKITNRLRFLEQLFNHPKTSEAEKASAKAAIQRIKNNPANADLFKQAAEDVPGLWNNPNMFVGGRYQRGQDIKDIAATLRKEFRAARKYAARTTASGDIGLAVIDPIGDIPESFKISVRIDRFSGGQSIDIAVTNVPKEDGEWFTYEEDMWREMRLVPTRRLKDLIGALEDALDAFNYDGSDTQTDYFNVNFYGHVTINGVSYSRR